MFYFRRRDSGFSILEMVVAVTILTIVVSLFYLYNNKGMRFYDKILNFDRVQINAKSSMETIINNLREASKEYIFVGSGYNSRVPLPEDIIISEPMFILLSLSQTLKKSMSKVSRIKLQEKLLDTMITIFFT